MARAPITRKLTLCSPPVMRPGGGVTFQRAFSKYVRDDGHQLSEVMHKDCEIFLANGYDVSPESVKEAIRINPRVTVVHRVDGSSEAYKGNGREDMLQVRVNALADLTIYQSLYSRAIMRGQYPEMQDGPVVYNAADLGRFAPPAVPPSLERVRMAFVAYSTYGKKGWYKVAALAERYPEYDFILVGNAPYKVEGQSNLISMGRVGHDKLSEVLGGCHIFLALMEDDACPNVVIEAMACGLPVLYVASGALEELVDNAGLPLEAEPSLGIAVEKIMMERDRLATIARGRAETVFHPDNVFGAYLSLMADRVGQKRHWRKRLRLVKRG